MAIFEYSRWDGSQKFSPLSAEAAFDKLAEYLLEYGDHVLRELEVVRAEQAREHRDQPARLAAEHSLDLGVDGLSRRVNPLHHMLARRPR